MANEQTNEATDSERKSYIQMPQTNTYALGMHALQKACEAEKNPHQPQIALYGRKVYRSNTFLENILARLEDFNTFTNPDGSSRSMDERLRYFNTWLDSCCGVAYKAGLPKLKLKHVCPQLVGISKYFSKGFLPIDYAFFKEDVELDRSSQNFVREGWIDLLEGQEKVYREYLALLKEIKNQEIIPNFWVLDQDSLKTDKLRAVNVSNLDSNSIAYGNGNLSNDSRFLRRSPPATHMEGGAQKEVVPDMQQESLIVSLTPQTAVNYLIDPNNREKVLAALGKKEYTSGLHNLLGELLKQKVN
ncbi:hypothetical protein HZC30_00950 [Candidatus Woesearchaeota archaeon]|nr:hypothetical protein [Candidatus Woesearchaeota archaeon]